MAHISTLFITLLVLLAFSPSGVAAQSKAKKVLVKKPTTATLSVRPPGPRCFRKVTKCCWRFATCGIAIRTIKTPALCPTKKCAKKCFKLCKPKPVHAVKKECYKTLTFGKVCTKHPWLPAVCVKVPQYKKYCKDYKTADVKLVCKQHCHTLCTLGKKKCAFLRVFHHAKFCAKLSCGKQATLGTSTKPADYVSPKGKFIKKTTLDHKPIIGYKGR